MRCVATPGGVTKETRDVDNDGQPDTFVCAIHPTGSNQGTDEEKGDDSSEKADASEESGDAHEGNNQEQDDDCAKMGCRDLRQHDGEHGAEQEGKAESDDGKNESDGGDDMTCPAPSGATDAGTGSG